MAPKELSVKLNDIIELLKNGKTKNAITALEKLAQAESKKKVKSDAKATKKPKRVGAKSSYSQFVSDNFQRLKQANPGKPAKEIMKLIAVEWNKQKSDSVSLPLPP